MRPPHPAFAGLGNAQQIGNQVIVPAINVVGAASAKSIAVALGMSVPIVGAALAGVTIALSAWFNRKGPRQKEITTQIVNELEQQLQANLDAYLAGPRTFERQLVALDNFDRAWAWLKSAEACGNSELGNPGRRCVSDRERGGPWPWEVYYRDPIANDPTVQPPAEDSPLSFLTSGANGGGVPGWLPLAAAAGLIAAAVWL